MNSTYDIIGDVHGQADALLALLRKMGYRDIEGTWRHPSRRAIFVGDFVDRGPKQVEAVTIVRRMLDAGSALAVMGNHDFNAIAWYLPDPANPGDFLRSHLSMKSGKKNRQQHAVFLAEAENRPTLHEEIIDWLLSLPLWLDLPELRVIHACWHTRCIEYLAPRLLPGAHLNRELMLAATHEPVMEEGKSPCEPSIFNTVGMLLKGLEVPLPIECNFDDKDGLPRSRARVRWWANGPLSYRKGILLDARLRAKLPNLPIPRELPTCEATGKPIFFGHYSFSGKPEPLSPRLACVDYGAGHQGPLCAYRWDGESSLDASHFCLVRT
jgi:hypothetical protein